jgi:enoyl-CoA hydratase/carnithine racemase
MEYQNFDVEIAEGSARISLTGPGAPDMSHLCDEFTDLMLRLEEDRAVRMVLFVDGDHAFDFHHNLDGLADNFQQEGGFELLAADEEIGRRIVTLISECPKPVVAATRGDIRNMGFGFFMAADIKLASSEATFTAPDLTSGLLPGWGLSHTLPRLLGPGRTLELLWNRRTISAREAYQLGLVDRLIEADQWEEELDSLSERLRSLPQPAVQLTKLGVQQAAQLDTTTMLSFDWEGQQQCWASLETGEGLQAHREGRVPHFDIAISDEEED